MYKKVKIKSLEKRGKAYFITDYNGNEDYFPISTVIATHDEVYIQKWILEKKSINYSIMGKDYYYKNNQLREFKTYTTEVTTPEKVNFNSSERPNQDLLK